MCIVCILIFFHIPLLFLYMIVFDYLELNSWSNMAFGVCQCEENHKGFNNSTIFATWCTCELHTCHTESNY